MLREVELWLNADILDVEGPQVMNTEVQGQVDEIPKDLCYAAKHWLSHFVKCQPDDRLIGLLDAFV